MKKTPLTDKSLHHQCLGDLKLADDIYSLVPVEQYIIDSCTDRGVFWSYDVTADEPYAFYTINYATFAGMFSLTPLQPEHAARQMYCASRNTSEETDFVGYLRDRVKSNNANKYQRNTVDVDQDFDAVVVLPGDNRIKTHVCLRKLKKIIDTHKSRVIFKPHPLTTPSVLAELKQLIGANDQHFAPIESDLYELIPRADVVYTSNLSESAIYATVLEKSINPIDQFHRTRGPQSFGHINNILFSEPNAIDLINSMFSSYKSGIVCPAIEQDWRTKIDQYLDYIITIRNRVKDFYITE